jgi:dolichyl-phosphate-mannose--protein O-mannosyl transferase
MVTLDGLQCRDGAGILGSPFSGYDGIYLVGRALAALSDVLALLVLFLTGRRLYGPRVAALGVLLMAGAVMLIQQSHFYTVDAYANLFVSLALYFAVRGAQDGRWYDFALFGLATAASVASKVNTAPIAGWSWWRACCGPCAGSTPPARPRPSCGRAAGRAPG